MNSFENPQEQTAHPVVDVSSLGAKDVIAGLKKIQATSNPNIAEAEALIQWASGFMNSRVGVELNKLVSHPVRQIGAAAIRAQAERHSRQTKSALHPVNWVEARVKRAGTIADLTLYGLIVLSVVGVFSAFSAFSRLTTELVWWVVGCIAITIGIIGICILLRRWVLSRATRLFRVLDDPRAIGPLARISGDDGVLMPDVRRLYHEFLERITEPEQISLLPDEYSAMHNKVTGIALPNVSAPTARVLLLIGNQKSLDVLEGVAKSPFCSRALRQTLEEGLPAMRLRLSRQNESGVLLRAGDNVDPDQLLHVSAHDEAPPEELLRSREDD